MMQGRNKVRLLDFRLLYRVARKWTTLLFKVMSQLQLQTQAR
jgi:hypothetical protein